MQGAADPYILTNFLEPSSRKTVKFREWSSVSNNNGRAASCRDKI